jgi:hypothetical protein
LALAIRNFVEAEKKFKSITNEIYKWIYKGQWKHWLLYFLNAQNTHFLYIFTGVKLWE